MHNRTVRVDGFWFGLPGTALNPATGGLLDSCLFQDARVLVNSCGQEGVVLLIGFSS